MLFCYDQSVLDQKPSNMVIKKNYFRSQTVCNVRRMPLTSAYKDISNSLGKCKRAPKSRTCSWNVMLTGLFAIEEVID